MEVLLGKIVAVHQQYCKDRMTGSNWMNVFFSHIKKKNNKLQMNLQYNTCQRTLSEVLRIMYFKPMINVLLNRSYGFWKLSENSPNCVRFYCILDSDPFLSHTSGAEFGFR